MRNTVKVALSLILILTLGTFVATSEEGVQYLADQPMAYSEAPELAEMVEAGELPPVEDRLPPEPVVIDPMEEIGVYGGTYHHSNTYANFSWYQRSFLYEPLIRWNWDASELVPGLARDWEFSEGGRVLTIYLREGVKWSDGQAEFTVDDFLFWYEDLVLHDDYPGTEFGFHGWWEGMELEKIDKYTMELHFDEPSYMIPLALANHYSFNYLTPKHYLKQFHPDYSDEYDDFEALVDHQLTWRNPDVPVLYAWQTVESRPGVRVVAERNPYYWKVDSVGNQLPYLDRVWTHRPESGGAQATMAAAGEFDFIYRRLDLKDYPMYIRRGREETYNVITWPGGHGANPVILPNLSHDDEVMFEILNSKEFRRALSLAIDREEINELFYMAMGKPKQATISSQSWHFTGVEGGEQLRERWENHYSEFNLEKANEYLDRAGFEWGPDGERRLGPDGRPIELRMLIDGDVEAYREMAPFMIENWEEIGVTVHADPRPAVTFDDMRYDGNFELQMFGIAEHDLPSYPAWIAPAGGARWAPEWQKYYDTDGAEGTAPPEGHFVWELWDLLDEAVETEDPTERHRIVHEMIEDYHIEEGPIFLGTVGDQPTPVIVKDYFHNHPPEGPPFYVGPWAIGELGRTEPAQYFIEEQAQ